MRADYRGGLRIVDQGGSQLAGLVDTESTIEVFTLPLA